MRLTLFSSRLWSHKKRMEKEKIPDWIKTMKDEVVVKNHSSVTFDSSYRHLFDCIRQIHVQKLPHCNRWMCRPANNCTAPLCCVSIILLQHRDSNAFGPLRKYSALHHLQIEQQQNQFQIAFHVSVSSTVNRMWMYSRGSQNLTQPQRQYVKLAVHSMSQWCCVYVLK